SYHPEFDNVFGAGEKWLLAGDGVTWYFLTSDGTLSLWDGSSAASGTNQGNVGTSFYADPSRLSGNVLTVTRDPAWLSGLVVSVTVSDGPGGADSRAFTVTVA